jgi:hypothetical protein
MYLPGTPEARGGPTPKIPFDRPGTYPWVSDTQRVRRGSAKEKPIGSRLDVTQNRFSGEWNGKGPRGMRAFSRYGRQGRQVRQGRQLMGSVT